MGLQKLNTGNSELDRVQDNVAKAYDPLLAQTVGLGILQTGVALKAASVTQVSHLLGRRPLGYFIVGRSANAIVWDSVSAQPGLFLNLHTSADVIVSLYVF